jgi:hypothetical protein
VQLLAPWNSTTLRSLSVFSDHKTCCQEKHIRSNLFSVYVGGHVINNPNLLFRKWWCILKNETLARSSEGTFQLVETPCLFFFSFWFLCAIPGEYIMGKKLIILKKKSLVLYVGQCQCWGFSHIKNRQKWIRGEKITTPHHKRVILTKKNSQLNNSYSLSPNPTKNR